MTGFLRARRARPRCGAFSVALAMAVLPSALLVAGSPRVSHAECLPGPSLLLVQTPSDNFLVDGFAPTLSVRDSCGADRGAIEVPGNWLVRPTGRPATALVYAVERGDPRDHTTNGDATGPVSLVDAVAGTARPLPIPALRVSAARFAADRLSDGGSRRFALVGSLSGESRLYLVDLESGGVVDLIAGLPPGLVDPYPLDGAAIVPGDAHVVMHARAGAVVVPVADPGAAFTVGDPSGAGRAALSPDGRRFVLSVPGVAAGGVKSEGNRVQLTDLAGTNQTVLATPAPGPDEMFFPEVAFTTDGGHVVVSDPTVGTRVYAADTGAEVSGLEELPSDCTPDLGDAPTGDVVLFGCPQSTPARRVFDPALGVMTGLPELSRFEPAAEAVPSGTGEGGFPLTPPPSTAEAEAWWFFAPMSAIDRELGLTVELTGDVGALRGLDRASGRTVGFAGLPAVQGIVRVALAAGDPSRGLALVLTYSESTVHLFDDPGVTAVERLAGAGELYLLDLDAGTAVPLVGAATGAFSPDGAWVAYTSYAVAGGAPPVSAPTGFATELWVMPDGGPALLLGPGIGTWLVV